MRTEYTAGDYRRTAVVLSSLLLLLLQGCAHDVIGTPLQNPEAERRRLGNILSRQRLNRDDEYLVRVHLAEAETQSLGKGVPSYYKYKSVIQLIPSRPEARVSYARMAVAMFDREGSYVVNESPDFANYAVAWMSEVIARDSGNAEYFILRSRCYLAQRSDPQRARADMDRAAAIAPNDPSVWIQKARALIACGDYPSASDLLGRAIGDPSLPLLQRSTAHALMGRSAQLQKQTDMAIAEYEAALKDNPDNIDALYGKAVYEWAKHGRSSDFYDLAEHTKSLSPNAVLVWFASGLRFMQSDRYGDDRSAMGCMRSAATADPANPIFRQMMEQINAEARAYNQHEKEMMNSFLGVAAAGFAAGAVHDMYMNNLPKLEKADDKPWDVVKENVFIKLRNTRGPGKVWVRFSQGSTVWKRIFTVEAATVAEYQFHLPGVDADRQLTHSEFLPVEKVSAEDLKDAKE